MVRRYRAPFLREVIVRLDFASPVTGLGKTVPPRLRDIISPWFPISEPREFIGKELLVTKDTTKEKTVEGTDWYFHSMDRQKTLIVCRSNVNITYKKYDSFDVLKQDFLPIVEELFDAYNDLGGKRLGLRYINEIGLSESNILDWRNYLDERLLTGLSFPQDSNKICRAFNNLELNEGGLMIRFQYGVFNDDYPAPVRKKSFILDYDAYYQGPQDLEDVRHNLDVFHDAVQGLFEYSISDGLRKLMGAEENG
jgi:uncharacterized protein (TIGR04255 family)